MHRVTIDKPFAIGVYEATFEEWDACVADGGCERGHIPRDQGWGQERRPVINVRWQDAQAYVAWLSQQTGLVYARTAPGQHLKWAQQSDLTARQHRLGCRKQECTSTTCHCDGTTPT